MSKEQGPKMRPKAEGIAARDKAAKEVYRVTRNPRAAVRRYCAGNKWATENAKAVGNW